MLSRLPRRLSAYWSRPLAWLLFVLFGVGMVQGLASPASAQIVLAECKGPLEPSLPGDCEGIESVGCCDLEGRVLYCDEGGLYCIDCAGSAPYCGWQPFPGYYDCNVDAPGQADPAGAAPFVCGGCAGCGPELACAPECAGPCGVCPDAGDVCLADGSCHTPECAGKQCGADSKGVSCGTCPGGTACDATLGVCVGIPSGCLPLPDEKGCSGCACEACVCSQYPGCCEEEWDLFCATACSEACGFDCSPCPAEPTCEGKSCGEYCGLDCGGCPAGDVCADYACCTPDCSGKACGPDGCGGQCGQCDPDEVCDLDSAACLPKVEGCEPLGGDGGCGGCPCEACVCAEDEFCCTFGWDEDCASLCVGQCGGCDPCEVLPGCEARECGVWCGEDCGGCGAGDVCFDFQCCTPSCDGQQCGDDGCGGSCGACGAGEACDDEGQCRSLGCEVRSGGGCEGCDCEACVCGDDTYCCDTQWDATCVEACVGCGTDCGGELPPNPCDDLPEVGCCFGNVRTACVNGHLVEEPCGFDSRCGWNEETQGFTCGTDGLGHPGLLYPKGCGTCPETCAIPKCNGECYGDCGVCPEGSACRDDGKCVLAGTKCEDDVLFEGACLDGQTVQFCIEATAEVKTLSCEDGEICDWLPDVGRYGCRAGEPGECTDACEPDEIGCAANGVWKYECRLDLATNCWQRAFFECAIGATCMAGICPDAVPCVDECEPGDRGCVEGTGDKWECEQDVGGCWFEAQLTCVYGCEDGLCQPPGPCGKTTFEGQCEAFDNTASFCVDDVLFEQPCGEFTRCLDEPTTKLSRCVQASIDVGCVDPSCL